METVGLESFRTPHVTIEAGIPPVLTHEDQEYYLIKQSNLSRPKPCLNCALFS